jgi:hypothetical protein
MRSEAKVISFEPVLVRRTACPQNILTYCTLRYPFPLRMPRSHTCVVTANQNRYTRPAGSARVRTSLDGRQPLNVGLRWTTETFHSRKRPRLAVVVPSGMVHAEPVTCEIDCTAARLERSDCRRAPALSGWPAVLRDVVDVMIVCSPDSAKGLRLAGGLMGR